MSVAACSWYHHQTVVSLDGAAFKRERYCDEQVKGRLNIFPKQPCLAEQPSSAVFIQSCQGKVDANLSVKYSNDAEGIMMQYEGMQKAAEAMKC